MNEVDSASATTAEGQTSAANKVHGSRDLRELWSADRKRYLPFSVRTGLVRPGNTQAMLVDMINAVEWPPPTTAAPEIALERCRARLNQDQLRSADVRCAYLVGSPRGSI